MIRSKTVDYRHLFYLSPPLHLVLGFPSFRLPDDALDPRPVRRDLGNATNAMMIKGRKFPKGKVFYLRTAKHHLANEDENIRNTLYSAMDIYFDVYGGH